MSQLLPLPTPIIGVVTTSLKHLQVGVYDSPVSGKLIARLNSGTYVEVIAVNDLWLQIKLPQNRVGFITNGGSFQKATDEEVATFYAAQRAETVPHQDNRKPSIQTVAQGMYHDPPSYLPFQICVGIGVLGISVVFTLAQSHPDESVLYALAWIFVISLFSLACGLVVGVVTWLRRMAQD